MGDNNGIRSGSLQFWPRCRAKKIIPSVNWKDISKKETGFLGFIGYKAGMVSVWAKDDTPDSMTKGKRIAIPTTVLECPTMRIYSVRFYKNGKVSKDVVVANDKILKKRVKVSKDVKVLGDEKDFEDVRAILYSNVKDAAISKKVPDMLEVGVSGSKEDKLKFIRDKVGKDISVTEVFGKGLVDVRAVTRGFGTQGPVDRMGISLKNHKSEKGVRRPGSLAPWHPARVSFRTPMMGQTGYQTRVSYNSMILEVGKTSQKDVTPSGGFNHYGIVKNDYVLIKGSIPGPKKRGIVITQAMRPTKKQMKKKFEVLELR
jgi:large subunit ribosomal protein L3